MPAPQSMHAAELEAPVAELYVPAEGRTSSHKKERRKTGEARAANATTVDGERAPPAVQFTQVAVVADVAPAGP